MQAPLSPFVLTAVHMGPYQSVLALEAPLGSGRVIYVVEGISREHRQARGEPFLDFLSIEAEYGDLAGFMDTLKPAAVIRSSSEGVDGTNVESLLASVAAERDVPVFVVEDFSGNFWAKPEERVDALFVEDEATAKRHLARGIPRERVYATGNPRYDALRKIDRLAKRAETRRALGLSDENVVLWVGQPHGRDSYRTLELLLPHFKEAGATLLFRAHPRDLAYRGGKYAPLLAAAGIAGLDVSQLSDVIGLCCASDLVVTQFSSVAVEAGYVGTPALFALFDEVGGRYFRTHKGYAVPPWCENGSAFLIDDAKMGSAVINRAMHDGEARRAILENFARHYTERPESALAIATVIDRTLGG